MKAANERMEALENTVDTKINSQVEILSTGMESLEKRIVVMEEIATIKVRLSDREKDVEMFQRWINILNKLSFYVMLWIEYYL